MFPTSNRELELESFLTEPPQVKDISEIKISLSATFVVIDNLLCWLEQSVVFSVFERHLVLNVYHYYIMSQQDQVTPVTGSFVSFQIK